MGAHFSCARRSDLTVHCWGRDNIGQLGNGPGNAGVPLPAPVPGLAGATAIGAGQQHVCAALGNGELWCWGDNTSGQLGNGSVVNAISPVQVTSGLTFESVGGGTAHTCAVTDLGEVWCMGDNASGQLGDGSAPNDSSNAVQVTGLGTGAAVAVGVGDDHTCAAMFDGTVWCWGDNTYGQLGDGSTTPTDVAVQVTGLTGVVGVAAGEIHSCAVTSGGQAWCWGRGAHGRLGNGGTADSPVPVLVSDP